MSALPNQKNKIDRLNQIVLDSLTSHIAVLDNTGFIIAVNTAWVEFAARNGAEGVSHVGMSYLEVCDLCSGKDSEEAPLVAKGIRDIIEGRQKFYTLEYPCHSPTERNWFCARITPYDDEDLKGVVVSHENITERKIAENKLLEISRDLEKRIKERTEELAAANYELRREIREREITEQQLRQSEEKFRQIVETSEEGMWIVNGEGMTTFVNRKMARMLGYSLVEMLGKPMEYFMDEEGKKLASKKIQSKIEIIKQRRDFKFIKKAGGEVWAIISANPIYDSSGELEGMLAMLTDITERKMAEEHLLRSEANLAEAQNIAMLGSWEWDIESNIIRWSDVTYRIFGYQPGEVEVDLDFYLSHIHPDDRDRITTRVQSMRNSKEIDEAEFRIVRKDGESRYVYSKSYIDLDNSGKAYRAYGALQDITQRKLSEQALIEAEQKQTEAARMAERSSRMASIGVMASGITHEINQPLNLIRLTADSILMARRRNIDVPVEEMIENFSAISEHVKRMDKIIQHMREFWVSPTSVSHELFDLNEAIAKGLTLIEQQLSSHRIDLEFSLTSTPLKVSGNRIHIEQIVINLVANSMHALDEIERERKVISVITEKRGNNARLVVKDNGPGFSVKHPEDLFDPFFSTRKPGSGTGLGLAIVKRFVDELSGKIEAMNNETEGAKFIVMFPLNGKEAAG